MLLIHSDSHSLADHVSRWTRLAMARCFPVRPSYPASRAFHQTEQSLPATQQACPSSLRCDRLLRVSSAGWSPSIYGRAPRRCGCRALRGSSFWLDRGFLSQTGLSSPITNIWKPW